jgi:DNA-binding transcriptional ArsR family regulator
MSQSHEAPADRDSIVEQLRALLEGFSLTGYEARVLAALVRLRQATAKQLSARTGISQPNVYPALDSLATKNLVQRRPGSTVTWLSPGAEEVVTRGYERRSSGNRGSYRLEADHMSRSTQWFGRLVSRGRCRQGRPFRRSVLPIMTGNRH